MDEKKLDNVPEVDKVRVLIQRDHDIPWENGEVGFTYSPNTVMPSAVSFLYSYHTCTGGPCRNLYVVESYDGKHELNPKDLYHNRLVCWLSQLLKQWERADNKELIEDTMKAIRKTVEMEQSLKDKE